MIFLSLKLSAKSARGYPSPKGTPTYVRTLDPVVGGRLGDGGRVLVCDPERVGNSLKTGNGELVSCRITRVHNLDAERVKGWPGKLCLYVHI